MASKEIPIAQRGPARFTRIRESDSSDEESDSSFILHKVEPSGKPDECEEPSGNPDKFEEPSGNPDESNPQHCTRSDDSRYENESMQSDSLKLKKTLSSSSGKSTGELRKSDSFKLKKTLSSSCAKSTRDKRKMLKPKNCKTKQPTKKVYDEAGYVRRTFKNFINSLSHECHSSNPKRKLWKRQSSLARKYQHGDKKVSESQYECITIDSDVSDELSDSDVIILD